jgi:hypothetical protein
MPSSIRSPIRHPIPSSNLLAALAAAVLPTGAALPRTAAAERAPAVHDPATNTWRLPRELAAPLPAGKDAPAALAGGDCVWNFAPNVRTHPAQAAQSLWPDVAYGPSGLVGVAWMDDHLPGGYHIFYSASTDGGLTWSPTEKVDTRTVGSYSKFPDLDFTPSGIPVVVWEDDRLGGINVFLSRRDPANGGIPWTPNVRVNSTGGSPSQSDFMNPSLAVRDNGRFYVAWTDWREGVFHQVYMRRTSDAGATWGTETRVSDGLGFEPVAGDPCLIADPTSGAAGGEVLFCVTNDWRGFKPGGRFPNVYAYRSTNGGSTWSVGVQVNDIEPFFQQVSSHALVRVEDGTLAAGWLNGDFASSRFHVCVSTDLGQTWSASVPADPPLGGGVGTYSSLAVAGGTVFAGFDLYEGNWNAYFRASPDGGRTWTEGACRMDDDASGSPSGNTVLAARTATEVMGAWMDGRPGGPWQIYSSRGIREAAAVDPEAAPGASGIAPASLTITLAPNPSSMGGTVAIGVGEEGAPAMAAVPLRFRILDAQGRTVAILDPSASGSGLLAQWDGTGGRGRAVPAGVYWVTLETGSGARAAAVRLVRLP